jgi:hypothetical protein
LSNCIGKSRGAPLFRSQNLDHLDLAASNFWIESNASPRLGSTSAGLASIRESLYSSREPQQTISDVGRRRRCHATILSGLRAQLSGRTLRQRDIFVGHFSIKEQANLERVSWLVFSREFHAELRYLGARHNPRLRGVGAKESI